MRSQLNMTSVTQNQASPERALSSMPMEPTGTPAVERGFTDSTSPEPGPTSVDVIAVPTDKVAGFWPHVRGYVWSAFEQFPGEMDLPTLMRKLAIGEGTLWVVYGDGRFWGGAITQLYDYPSFRAVQIVGLGGERFETWHDEMNVWLEKYGRLHGAKRLEFYGRKGW